MALPPLDPPPYGNDTFTYRWREWLGRVWEQVTTSVADIAGKVSKSGDTMTGTLNMDAADIKIEDGVLWATGDVGAHPSTGSLGTKFMWIPEDKAFIAGGLGYRDYGNNQGTGPTASVGTEWDNPGLYSANFGADNIARNVGDFVAGGGNYCPASAFPIGVGYNVLIGQGNEKVSGGISGNNTAIGNDNYIAGGNSGTVIGSTNTINQGGLALGGFNEALATSSVAIGKSNTADADTAVTIGKNLDSSGFAGVVMLGKASTPYSATAANTIYVMAGGTTPMIEISSAQGTINSAEFVISGNLQSSGRIEETTSRTSGPYTLLDTDENILCDTTTGGFVVTMPSTPTVGRVYTITKTATVNTLTVNSASGNTLQRPSLPYDLISSFAITGYGSVTLLWNGTYWGIK